MPPPVSQTALTCSGTQYANRLFLFCESSVKFRFPFQFQLHYYLPNNKQSLYLAQLSSVVLNKNCLYYLVCDTQRAVFSKHYHLRVLGISFKMGKGKPGRMLNKRRYSNEHTPYCDFSLKQSPFFGPSYLG